MVIQVIMPTGEMKFYEINDQQWDLLTSLQELNAFAKDVKIMEVNVEAMY